MIKNLILFIKNPVIGSVKTRLAETIGEELALQVYMDLMQKSCKETLAVSAERYLFYSKEIVKDNWSVEQFKKRLQAEGSLGFKMKSAFAEVVKKNSKTIIIGSDCYDLTSRHIELAFKELDANDLVLGPANDGGYYLLGMKKFIPELFEGIAWSTELVMQQTLKKADQLDLKVKCLQELIDIDNIADLKESGYSLKTNRRND